jgi:hypothetical protein
LKDVGRQHVLSGLAGDYDRMAEETTAEMAAEIDARRKAAVAQNSS